MSANTVFFNLASDAAPLRVLIVEDDPMMQLGLESSLMVHPQLEIVGQAEDGYLGVQAALKLKPDVVVMDIGLPRLDGIAATQQIKRKQKLLPHYLAVPMPIVAKERV
jgi:two-component system, NarL family, response regulator LiaR